MELGKVREQVERGRVVARWGPMSPSVDFDVPKDCPRLDYADGVVPVSAAVRDEKGEVTGEILVWVAGGLLASLEYAWFVDPPPDRLPPPERIDVESSR